MSQQPACLSSEERKAIRRLAADIPALWHAPSTTAAERQTIVRQLTERIIVTVEGKSEKVRVQFHWSGGHKTETTLIRPVAHLEQLSCYKDLLNRVAELHAEQKSSSAIAQILNDEGWHPAKRRETFNREMAQNLLIRQGLRRSKKKADAKVAKKSSEWTLPDLAEKLGMPPVSLYSWIKKGKLEARRAQEGGRCIFLIDADEAEIGRLQSLRNQPRTWSKHVRILDAQQ